MIHIIIVEDNNTNLFDNFAVNLQTTGYTVTPPVDNNMTLNECLSTTVSRLYKSLDISQLNAVIHLAAQQLGIDDDSGLFNSKAQKKGWVLNASQLELIAPDGTSIHLSHNECRLLQAVASADGNLVSRKILIEALGYDYWQYDERCLETMISRLRRKLSVYVEEGFSIRGVKGGGYLFGMDVLEVLA